MVWDEPRDKRNLNSSLRGFSTALLSLISRPSFGSDTFLEGVVSEFKYVDGIYSKEYGHEHWVSDELFVKQGTVGHIDGILHELRWSVMWTRAWYPVRPVCLPPEKNRK